MWARDRFRLRRTKVPKTRDICWNCGESGTRKNGGPRYSCECGCEWENLSDRGWKNRQDTMARSYDEWQRSFGLLPSEHTTQHLPSPA
jgi:hypothetical protein